MTMCAVNSTLRRLLSVKGIRQIRAVGYMHTRAAAFDCTVCNASDSRDIYRVLEMVALNRLLPLAVGKDLGNPAVVCWQAVVDNTSNRRRTTTVRTKAD
jgi:hypothetical protein